MTEMSRKPGHLHHFAYACTSCPAPTGHLLHHVSLHNFAVFVYQEDGFFFAAGAVGAAGAAGTVVRAAAEPAAGMAETGLFGGFQGRFGIGMGNPSAGVNGLLYGPPGEPSRATVAR